MLIRLAALPSSTRGIYRIDGVEGRMFARALWLHPDAARAFATASESLAPLVCSDIYRSAEASLRAAREKRGVQPPGFSGHNFGVSIDVRVDEMLRVTGLSYPDFCRAMERRRWYPYRRDHSRGFEDWHFNWVPETADAALGERRWDRVAEHVIQHLYGPDLALTPKEIQSELLKLRFYRGQVDGILGPLSAEAVRAFQRAWGLVDDGDPGPKTQRTLAFVAAEYDRS